LTSGMLHFGKELLFKSDLSKKVLGCRVLEESEDEGPFLSLDYQIKGKAKITKTLRIPLPRDQMEDVKGFIRTHASFYNPEASIMSQAMAVGRIAVRAGRPLADALLH